MTNEELFKQDAKSIVDMCFDKRLFVETLTRDDMTAFEDLLAYVIQSRFDSHIRCNEMIERLEKHKQAQKNQSTNPQPLNQ